MLQLSAINIQLKDANRVFRLYIKSLGDKAVYRVEESVKLRSRLVDVLHTIRSPSQLLYKAARLDIPLIQLPEEAIQKNEERKSIWINYGKI